MHFVALWPDGFCFSFFILVDKNVDVQKQLGVEMRQGLIGSDGYNNQGESLHSFSVRHDVF